LTVTEEIIPSALRDDERVRASQVAAWLGVTPKTVGIWSKEGRLPPAIVIGPRMHVYRVGDLRAAVAKMVSGTPKKAKERK